MPTQRLGVRIRTLRESRNLSLDDLHQETKIAKETLDAIESSVYVPTLPQLVNISDALGVSVRYLVHGGDRY